MGTSHGDIDNETGNNNYETIGSLKFIANYPGKAVVVKDEVVIKGYSVYYKGKLTTERKFFNVLFRDTRISTVEGTVLASKRVNSSISKVVGIASSIPNGCKPTILEWLFSDTVKFKVIVTKDGIEYTKYISFSNDYTINGVAYDTDMFIEAFLSICHDNVSYNRLLSILDNDGRDLVISRTLTRAL